MKDQNDLNKLNMSNDDLSRSIDDLTEVQDKFSTVMDKTQEYTEQELNDELEQLAKTFKQELEKAQAMSEEELVKNGIIIQQYEDDDGVISEDELCLCCGEQRRDKSFGESYEYCRDCREAMKAYPFSVKSFAVLAVAVFFCVLSVISFAEDFDKYNTVKKADDYVYQNKLYSALEMYDSAISAFEEAEINPQKLYLETAEILFKTMPDGVASMEQVAEKIEAAISSMESKLPLYRKYSDMREEVLIINGTFQEFYTLLNSQEYAGVAYDSEENYKNIMTDINAIANKEVIVTSIDGNQIKKKTSEAAVRFCQYMFAYSTQNYDDCYKYMLQVSELAPDYLWLYAYELGNVELQKGNSDKALGLAGALYELNRENAGSYVLYSSVYRLISEEDKAIDWADKGLEIVPDDTELMRNKAMALIVKGDFESAKTVIDTAREVEDYGLLMLVSLVIENELGNKDAVKEIKKELKANSLEITDRVNSYLDGELSPKQLFTEGVGDVQ